MTLLNILCIGVLISPTINHVHLCVHTDCQPRILLMHDVTEKLTHTNGPLKNYGIENKVTFLSPYD